MSDQDQNIYDKIRREQREKEKEEEERRKLQDKQLNRGGQK